MMATATFTPHWRQSQSAAFCLEENSTAGRTVSFSLWGREVKAYANANLSVISAQECNADCPFCVEKLRSASRGISFTRARPMGEGEYMNRLAAALEALRPLNPSVSITGGEPSLDPALPRVLALLRMKRARKLTMTTNGAGLFLQRNGKRTLDWIIDCGVEKLNISRASADEARNGRVMRMSDGLDNRDLGKAIALAKAGGLRPRLSCALIDGEVDSLDGIMEYVEFARGLGADNVIFRELMRPEAAAMDPADPVAQYCQRKKIPLGPILERISQSEEFEFVRQVMGYYYYVEVWRVDGVDVVFESADLARIEIMKKLHPAVVHELVFHPGGRLCSTWQAWDGVLG
ncbi:MAG: radical SAM protein [Nitrospinota bacterium]|nr:radical SAM protein [Nitrospinota bacterium]